MMKKKNSENKKKFRRFVIDYLLLPFGIAGILAMVGCVLWQSQMFVYVSFILCFLVALAGLIAGFAVLKYLQNQAAKMGEFRHVTSKDFEGTAMGAFFLVFVSALLGFISSEILWFCVGVFGMGASSMAMLTYKMWQHEENRPKEEDEEE